MSFEGAILKRLKKKKLLLSPSPFQEHSVGVIHVI